MDEIIITTLQKYGVDNKSLEKELIEKLHANFEMAGNYLYKEAIHECCKLISNPEKVKKRVYKILKIE